MNLEKINSNEKPILCVQRLTHRLSVFKMNSGGYRVLKTYILDAFGLKAKALLSTPPSIAKATESFYLNGIQITDKSITHEFILEGLEVFKLEGRILGLDSVETLQWIYQKTLADLINQKLDLNSYESDVFLNSVSGEIEVLPVPSLQLGDFKGPLDYIDELPADIVFSVYPLLKCPKEKTTADLHAVAIFKAFFHYLRMYVLPQELELFYSPDKEDWERDHHRNVETICSLLPTELVSIAQKCFMQQGETPYSSFHDFKFDLLVAHQLLSLKMNGHQLGGLPKLNVLTKRHREIVNTITDNIIHPIHSKTGKCFLLQGPELGLNANLIKEVIASLPQNVVSVLSLREEGRNSSTDFNPLYELLNQLLDLICNKIEESSELKKRFFEEFKPELNYLAAFNKKLLEVFSELHLTEDFIGIGQVNDWELKKITHKLICFHLDFANQLLIVIDSNFRIGLNRSKTNSLDFLKLIEELPVSIIGAYNSGSTENFFNYRLSEFGKDLVDEYQIQFLDEEEVEEYLKATGLGDHRCIESLSRKLHSISGGSKENLDSILSQSIALNLIQVNNRDGLEWDLAKLNSINFFLPNQLEHEEVFKDLSPGEKVILKRCALVDGGVDAALLIHGVESTGQSGVNKLLERGFITKVFNGKTNSNYTVANQNLRNDILAKMEKREKVFLSIQLARTMSDLNIVQSPFLEGDLWAKVADYLAANNDKKKAVSSFLDCAKELLRISDYQSALSYLELASGFLNSESKVYYEAVWGEFCLLMAVACFRNRRERAAEEYFNLALSHSSDQTQKAKIRVEWINLCVLVGDHKKAISLSQKNFKELNFEVFGFVNYIWCFKLILLSWFNLHNKKQCLKPNKNSDKDLDRFSALIETVIASAASYFSVDRLKFHLLQGIMTHLSKNLNGTKYASFSLLNAGVLSGLLFNDLRKSKRYFEKAKMVSEKLGANFALSRISSVETMMIDAVNLNRKQLIEKLRSVANASLSNRDESFFLFAEQSSYLIEMMAGESAFSKLLRKVESSEYHSLKSNRREAYNNLEAIKQNIYRFKSQKDKLAFHNQEDDVESLSLSQSLEAFTRLLGLGMSYFFDEKYEQAEKAFKRASAGVFKNYSLPVRVYIAFFLSLSRIRKLQQEGVFQKVVALPRLLISIRWFLRYTQDAKELWRVKRVILLREFQYIFFPKIAIKNYQLSFYKYAGSWSLLDRIICSFKLSKVYLAKANVKISAKLLDQLLAATEELEFDHLTERLVSSYSDGDFVSTKARQRNDSILSDHWKKMIDLIVDLQKSSARDNVQKLVQHMAEFAKAEKMVLALLDESEALRLRLISTGKSYVVDRESLEDFVVQDICAYENLIYSLETGRVNRIENAMNDPSLLDRKYIEQNEVKSIYVMPIHFEDKEIGVLYLENNSIENAFSGLSNELPSLLTTMILSAIKKEEDNSKLNERVKVVEEELSEAREKIVSYTQRVESANLANETLHNLVGFLQSLSFEMEKFEHEGLKENSISMSLLRELNTSLEDYKGEVAIEPLSELVSKLNRSISRSSTNMDELTTAFMDKLQLLKQSIYSQQSIARGATIEREFSLSEAFSMAEEIMRPKFKELKIDYELTVKPEIYLTSTKVLWVQAFVNLFRNSTEAIKELRPLKPKVVVEILFQENHLVMRFKDNGIGFTSEDQNKIGEYGFSTKRDGHGFGLHSVSSLIKSVGGKMSLHSKGLGCGCQIDLEIPLNSLK